jgi:hypothetical protein
MYPVSGSQGWQAQAFPQQAQASGQHDAAASRGDRLLTRHLHFLQKTQLRFFRALQ